MKVFIFIVFITCFTFYVHDTVAHDTIVTQSQIKIPCKIYSVDESYVIYRKSSLLQGPDFKILLKDIKEIIYDVEAHQSINKSVEKNLNDSTKLESSRERNIHPFLSDKNDDYSFLYGKDEEIAMDYNFLSINTGLHQNFSSNFFESKLQPSFIIGIDGGYNKRVGESWQLGYQANFNFIRRRERFTTNPPPNVIGSPVELETVDQFFHVRMGGALGRFIGKKRGKLSNMIFGGLSFGKLLFGTVETTITNANGNAILQSVGRATVENSNVEVLFSTGFRKFISLNTALNISYTQSITKNSFLLVENQAIPVGSVNGLISRNLQIGFSYLF